MKRHDLRRKLPGLGLFVLPIVLVKAAAIMLGAPGPQQSQAASNQEQAGAAAPAAIETPKWSEQQLQAARYVARLNAEPFGPSPFLHLDAPVAAVETVPASVDSTSKLALQAVMSSASVSRALINGRSYGVGEQVRDTNWIVQHIDIDSRSVRLIEAKNNRSMTITVELPR